MSRHATITVHVAQMRVLTHVAVKDGAIDEAHLHAALVQRGLISPEVSAVHLNPYGENPYQFNIIDADRHTSLGVLTIHAGAGA